MQQNYNLRNPAVKRLMKEAKELCEPTELYYAQPLDDNLFEWHFTFRGPEDSDFEGGIYHGRIILPPEYPMKPPSIIIVTGNGRFELHKKICLSISGHHPESWQPSWSIRTAILAIIGFMPTHGNGAIGSLDYKPEEKKVLARRSTSFICQECGAISKILKPVTKASEKASKEAKELASQISFQGEKSLDAAKESTAKESTEGKDGEAGINSSTSSTNDIPAGGETTNNYAAAAPVGANGFMGATMPPFPPPMFPQHPFFPPPFVPWAPNSAVNDQAYPYPRPMFDPLVQQQMIEQIQQQFFQQMFQTSAPSSEFSVSSVTSSSTSSPHPGTESKATTTTMSSSAPTTTVQAPPSSSSVTNTNLTNANASESIPSTSSQESTASTQNQSSVHPSTSETSCSNKVNTLSSKNSNEECLKTEATAPAEFSDAERETLHGHIQSVEQEVRHRRVMPAEPEENVLVQPINQSTASGNDNVLMFVFICLLSLAILFLLVRRLAMFNIWDLSFE